MTIMPLILGSEYRRLGGFAMGGKLRHGRRSARGTGAGHPGHQPRGVRVPPGENFIAGMGQMVSLGWLGESVSLYTEEDPFWSDLAKVKEYDLGKFFEKNVGRLPVALRIDASNPLKLAMFLTSAGLHRAKQSGTDPLGSAEIPRAALCARSRPTWPR